MPRPYHHIAARLAATLLVTACAQDASSPTTAQTTAQLAAANMTRAADSLAATGDSANARPLRAAAAALAAIGHSVPVTLTDNGTTATYQAVAQRYTVPSDQCPAPPTTPPAAGDTTRPPLPKVGCTLGRAPVLILWQGTSADQVIMISAPEGTTVVSATPSGPPSGPPPATEPTRGSFSDRAARGMWAALDGSVTLGASSGAATCAASPKLPAGVAATCAVGELTGALDVTFGMPPRPAGAPAPPPLVDTTARRRIVLASTAIPVALMTITDAGPTIQPGMCGGPGGPGGGPPGGGPGGGRPGGGPPGGGPPGGGPPGGGPPGAGGPPCGGPPGGGPGGGRPPGGPPGGG